MNNEIERKWLLHFNPICQNPKLEKLYEQIYTTVPYTKKHYIEQIYIGRDSNSEVRVRNIDCKYFEITQKSTQSEMSRIELNTELDPEIGRDMFNTLRNKFGNKYYSDKHRIEVDILDGLKLCIDEFHSDKSGLFIAEIEFPDEETAKNFTIENAMESFKKNSALYELFEYMQHKEEITNNYMFYNGNICRSRFSKLYDGTYILTLND